MKYNLHTLTKYSKCDTQHSNTSGPHPAICHYHTDGTYCIRYDTVTLISRFHSREQLPAWSLGGAETDRFHTQAERGGVQAVLREHTVCVARTGVTSK
jgi:hypothetical protein